MLSLRRRGYLTMAVGKRRYLEMAVDMALSLREHTDLPIAIAADKIATPTTRLNPKMDIVAPPFVSFSPALVRNCLAIAGVPVSELLSRI